MRVLFDHQAFSIQDFGGVSRCFSEVYKHLPDDVDAQLGLLESNNKYVQGWDGINPKGYFYNHFICKKDFWGKGHLFLWIDRFRNLKYCPDCNKNFCIELLKQGEFDIFHPTYFDDYFLPYLKGKPFVLTIHDMIPERFEGLDEWQKEKKAYLSKRAAHIITVSHHSKKDIINLLGIPEERITVVYHGAPEDYFVMKDPMFGFPYIAYPGSRGFYKNFSLMLRYLRGFLKRHKGVYLVCTGPDFSETEKQLISELDLKESIIHCFIEEKDLGSFYHHAVCLVYPSAYEGFGLPILEAFKAECPVLLNNASCFPEIAGDAAVYFRISDKSSNLEEMLETIWNYSPQTRKELIERQNKRLCLFSWTKSAIQMAEVYRKVIRSK